MPIIKTSELEGGALDWAVARLESEASPTGMNSAEILLYRSKAASAFSYKPHAISYSTDWAAGGQIIERENITVICAEGEYSSDTGRYSVFWVAEKGALTANEVYGSQGDNYGSKYEIDEDGMSGPTPLIAAMRCYVASKLGPKVDIPDELIEQHPTPKHKGPAL